MRIQSPQQITLKNGDVGWIHPVNVRASELPPPPRPAPVINCSKLMEGWARETEHSWINRFALTLGVTPEALLNLRVAWAREFRAWAFPMLDGYLNYVGIRLRSEDGSKKWAVRGSHQGIFVPAAGIQHTCVICEGPTDTAAALSIGLFAIGRPSCSGNVMDVDILFRRLPISRAIIVADNDEPGIKGAEALGEQLTSRSVNPIPTVVVVLPTKDMREFVQAGGNRELLEAITSNYVWNNQVKQ